MNFLSVLFIYIAAIVSSSLQASPEEAKQAIEAARKDAEKRLIATKPATLQILNDPIAKLRDLEKGGKESVDLMVSFKGPGDRNKAIDSSISFWKEKMEEIIKPFIDNAETNKLLAVDYAPISPPRPELKEQYRVAAMETKKILEEADSAFLKMYSGATSGPSATVEDVAKINWLRLVASWPIREQAEFVEKQSVNFGIYEQEKERLQNIIKHELEKFKEAIRTIHD